MKTFKKSLFTVLFFLPLLMACDEREVEVPKEELPQSEWLRNYEMTPIRTILDTYKGQACTPISEEIFIKGTITANDVSGNVYKQIQIQDSTGGINIQIDATGLSGSLPIGQDIVVKCQGLAYGEYGTLPQLGVDNNGTISRVGLQTFDQNHAQKDGAIDIKKVTVPELTIDQLSVSSPLVGTLITVKDVYFEKGGTELYAEQPVGGGNPQTLNKVLKPSSGSGSLTARISSAADFAANTLPKGTGSVTGILTVYNSTLQILFRTYADCSPDRFTYTGSGTQASPYSIEYALEKQDGSVSGWIEGYIVGAAAPGVSDAAPITGNSGISFAAPYFNNSVVLAQEANITDWTKVVVVELPAGTDIRTVVNLSDHPENIGKKLQVNGTLRTKWGAAGLTTDGAASNFKLEGAVSTGEVLYSETFGTAATASPWPSVADYTGYTTTGAGAGQVTYTSEGGTVSIRGNAVSSYQDASGGCNAMMAATGASLIINDIATCGATTLHLQFGANETSSVMSVAYKINGTSDWVSIPYTKTSDSWELVSGLDITLPAGANTIKLKFTAATTTYGTRVDDITLTTSDPLGTPVIDPDNGGSGGGGTETGAIFLETCGEAGPSTGTRPSPDTYTDWDNGAPITYSGNADIRSTGSLNSHLWFAAWSELYPDYEYLTISGINTAGCSNMTLSFDMTHNGESGVTANLMSVVVTDLNTNTETTLTVPATDLGAKNTFKTISGITGIPATSNLQIKFSTSNTNTMGIRLDNIRIDGTKP